jgi:hypothetical protein
MTTFRIENDQLVTETRSSLDVVEQFNMATATKTEGVMTIKKGRGHYLVTRYIRTQSGGLDCWCFNEAKNRTEAKSMHDFLVSICKREGGL